MTSISSHTSYFRLGKVKVNINFYSTRFVAKGEGMGIVVNLDVMLAKRKMRSKEIAKKVGITEQNISILKSGKAKAIRFSTLEAICKHLNCQPGDILQFEPSDDSSTSK